MPPPATSSQASRTRRGWVLLAVSLPVAALCGYLIFQSWHGGGENQATTITTTPGTVKPTLTHDQAMAKAVASIKLAPVPVAIVGTAPMMSLSHPVVPTIKTFSGAAIPRLAIPAPANTSALGVKSVAAMAIGVITGGTPPPIERERATLESSAAPDSSPPVQFDSNIESGTPVAVQQISPTHYVADIQTQGFRDWFMFHLTGVAGKTIRIDITGQGIVFDKWKSLDPVYTYASDLDDPATYACSEADSKRPVTKAWNGPELPATDDQQWHYIANCWQQDGKAFCFTQHFDSDQAYVAMRIPHPPQYSRNFLSTLSANSAAKVIQVGTASDGQPLQLVQVGSADDSAGKPKPCVLIYAGEHADEQDAMWVAQGAIEYLASGSPEAAKLGNQYAFLVIPMLDPATSTRGQHSGMITTFLTYATTPESKAYANWFQQWVRSGNRLDLVYDLHNVQSFETPDISCAIMEGKGTRGRISFALHEMLLGNLVADDYHVMHRPWMRGWSPDRLGGWLSRRYGALTFAYELNSQAQERHLNLARLAGIGAWLVRSIPQMLSAPDGVALLTDVDARRKEWQDSWTKYGAPNAQLDALNSELNVSRAANLRSDPKDPKLEKWID